VAKIRTGPIVAEIRNALGSQVFSRNQYGPYTRARVDPDNAATGPRVTTRNRLAAAVLSWNDDLSDLQRTAWDAYARANDKKLGRVGGRGLAGRATFISSFLNLSNIGATPLTDPPNQPVAGAVTNLSLTVDAETDLFELDGDVPADTPTQGLIIFATPPLPQSRYFNWPLARQIATYSPGWSFPLDLWDAYRSHFDDPGAPFAVTVYAIPVAEASGLAGVKQAIRALCTGEVANMLTKEVTLTDADIKALPTTPFEIVAAVAGKIILPLFLVLQVDTSAGAYTNITAGVGQFIRGIVGTDMTARALNSGTLGAAAQVLANLPSIQEADATPPTVNRFYAVLKDPAALTNVALELKSDNAAGNFTGGNAANTMKVRAYYQLVDPI
jgi:hypothetical protein